MQTEELLDLTNAEIKTLVILFVLQAVTVQSGCNVLYRAKYLKMLVGGYVCVSVLAYSYY